MTIRPFPAWRFAAALTLALSPVHAWGQDAPSVAAQPTLVAVAHAAASTLDTTGTLPAPAASPGVEMDSQFKLFVRDVGRDYKGYFSKGVALRLGIGGAAAGIIHIWDQDIADDAVEASAGTKTALKGGDVYGGPGVQYSLAAGWWLISHYAHSTKGADAGRDLLRAQISATSWTYLIKVVTSRERPNGDPRSFPSGHLSATFATATVLESHYGWKVGVPFYALGVYTGLSRLMAEKHWASDVVFGAAVGIASGYTVTRHLHAHAVTLGPSVWPGGAGISVTLEP